MKKEKKNIEIRIERSTRDRKSKKEMKDGRIKMKRKD